MPFQRQTVLILGAGSSETFPLGWQLVRGIVSDSVFGKNPALHSNGVSEQAYAEFLKQLKFADPASIDAFLEENPDLIKVGRLAIANQLISAEKEDSLFPPFSSENNWYKTFANSIGISKNGKPSENKVTIFTYNYDRSLEHYLTRVIQNRMRTSEGDAEFIRKKISIHHLHGSLGSLEHSNPNFRPYSSKIDQDSLRVASESIKIIHEQSDDYECKTELQMAIQNAEQIYFFGFGYHPVNMRRLMNSGLREKLSKKDGCKIVPLRYNIIDRVWKKILKEQFEDLIPFTSESSNNISGYLYHYGFGID